MQLPESYNVRDLGGYPTADGGQTRWHVLLRAGNLDRLTVSSQQTLLSFGLASVIDLRDRSEVARYPDVFAGSGEVVYLNLPIVRVDSQVWRAELTQRYLLMVRECRAEIRSIVQAIALSSFPLIIHCTAGKDRTGLIVALILAMLGVPADVIAADYAMSEPCLMLFFAKVRCVLQGQGADLVRFDRDSRAAPETILRVLRYVELRYGGVDGYLCLPPPLEQRLRQRLVEQARGRSRR
jgi:protein-tyrosine phosphatase